jgi:FKBP-type peptidyl-prolyl cis-trans isomerase FkpA
MRFFLFCGSLVALSLAHEAIAQSKAPEFQRTPSGIEYRLFSRDKAGKFQPRPLNRPGDAPYASRAGKLLTMHFQYRTGRDSILIDSRKMMPQPQPFPLLAQVPPGGLEEGLSLLLPGDSAVFRFQADSLFKKTFHQPVPPFIAKSGNVFLASIRAFELTSDEEIRAKLTAKDEAEILAYLKSRKATAKKTVGGTYYLVTRPGTGPLPKPGQTVSVLYRGTILSTGAEFDASAKHGNTPFSFTLGRRQVIDGWDQGVAMLPKGSKAVLYIPSALGYGARGAGPGIPPNSVLRFEVEVTDIK